MGPVERYPVTISNFENSKTSLYTVKIAHMTNFSSSEQIKLLMDATDLLSKAEIIMK
jgi:hypothetical protein